MWICHMPQNRVETSMVLLMAGPACVDKIKYMNGLVDHKYSVFLNNYLLIISVKKKKTQLNVCKNL